MNRNRLLISITLVLLGLVLWLLISPLVIGLREQTVGFTSFIGWLGLSITMFGIGIFFVGVGEFVSE